MKLNELYLPYERKNVDLLFNSLLKIFKSTKKVPYADKNLQPKPDEYLELLNINYPSELIYVYRRFNNPQKWDVSFTEVKSAIKYTIRSGEILGSGDYNKMTGTSNFVGTPLHILIALVTEDEYKKQSLVGKFLKHPIFGLAEVQSIDFKNDFVNINFDGTTKKIKMDYWDIAEKDFMDATKYPSSE